MMEKKTAINAPAGHVAGTCATRLWGISGDERARRTLTKAGIAGLTDDPATAGFCLMMRADWVIDPALIGLLKVQPGSVLTTRQDGAEVALAAHVARADAPALAAALAAPSVSGLPEHLTVVAHDPTAPPMYLPLLRKRLDPVVIPLTPANVDRAERATFKGSYKGVTDLVTKYVWPAPARHVTRWCAERRITPNMVTLFSLLLVFATFGLFAQGWFALGLVSAWVMTFLDTVDGKLARCTLTSTRFGNVFDHGIDMIHPPFWWWAWHMGCLHVAAAYPLADIMLAVTVIGYVVLRLQEAAFILLFGMQMHVWRRFDSRFRLVVARRNPILIILSLAAIFGEPGWGMVAVAAWTLISVLVHLVQIGQAVMAKRSAPLVSWMAA